MRWKPSSKSFRTHHVYNYFRDYDPATGRYVQSDPIGLRGGLNTYSFAFSNPITYFDPFGLKTCGSTPLQDRAISDNPLGYKFSGCCAAHDNCYGDCFTRETKGFCDSQFLKCMRESCEGLDLPNRIACRRLADIYYTGVDWGGGDAFYSARNPYRGFRGAGSVFGSSRFR